MSLPAESRTSLRRDTARGLRSPRRERGGLVGDLLAATARRWPDAICLTRRNAREAEPVTYGELDRKVEALAVGLRASGLSTGDRVALVADNCSAWLLADQACARAGLVTVPRGSDTSAAELDVILEHSGARGLIADSAQSVARLGKKPEKVFTFADFDDLARAGQRELDAGATVLEQTRGTLTSASLYTIVYTSGTTGKPKGVMLTHGNVTGNTERLGRLLDFGVRERVLSILPAWHMFERIIEYVCLANGCTITYTDRRRLKHDMRDEGPTIVAFVPRIWESIAAGIEQRLAELHGIKRWCAHRVLRLGERIARGRTTSRTAAWLHARLARRVFAGVHAALGSRFRLGVSGGGALPEGVDVLLLALGIPVLNGYGLTETSPVLTVRRPEQNRIASVGPPIPDTEIRIAESGEVLARGPQVMAGYYRDPELTRRVIDADGWFHTGDLGALSDDGWLTIKGRLKDTIVLANGENVEPEPIECAVRASPLVDQVIVVGQDRKTLAALVVPADATADREQIRRELDRLVVAERGFRAIDRIGPFAVVDEPFSTENGLLTATMKLKRHVIAERHAGLIDALYSRG